MASRGRGRKQAKKGVQLTLMVVGESIRFGRSMRARRDERIIEHEEGVRLTVRPPFTTSLVTDPTPFFLTVISIEFTIPSSP